MPGERRGGRKRTTPNRTTILADRMVAVLEGCPTASSKARLARLVNDQALPEDIRLAVAQNPFPGPSRAALNALFDIVCNANAPVSTRGKAALKMAALFLPKRPVNKRWRFTTDECGFAINAEIARHYRDIDFELRNLKRHPNRDLPEIAQRIGKLQAKRAAIWQRLECPCPSGYGAKEISEDYNRLARFAAQRKAGIALTAKDDAEEAHRKTRFDYYAEGPERTAQRRREHLEEADLRFWKHRFFDDPMSPALSRRERNDLWLLRWLYPPHHVEDRRRPEDRARAEEELAPRHPFYWAEPAADGNIYGADSKLRPASAGEADSIEGFVEYGDMPRYCIAISGQPMVFTDELLFHDAEPAADGGDSKSRPAGAGEPNTIEDFIEFMDVPPYCIAISGQPMIFTDRLPASLRRRDPGAA
jgi:hypothetical protein